MVCHEGHSMETSKVRNMRGRAAQGAMLNFTAINVGRHRARIYTTKARCSINDGLQRAAMRPCQSKRKLIKIKANKILRGKIHVGVVSRFLYTANLMN